MSEDTVRTEATTEELAVSANQTHEHIARVQYYMRRFAIDLLERADNHDQTKLNEPEATPFALANKDGFLNGVTYGSPEYGERIKKYLGPALAHHYANNSHHPEFHEEGVNGMDLGDFVEMFCDWKAAGERHADGCIRKSIEINKDRFKLDQQVVDILESTAFSLEHGSW